MGDVNKQRILRAAQWLIGGLFLLLTALPLLETVFQIDAGKGLSEKRTLASFPRLEPRLDSLKAFPSAFEAYYNDNFGFRQRLVRAFNYAMVVWLRTAPDRGGQDQPLQAEGTVILGKDGWLFYAGERIIEYHRSTTPFNDAGLRAWQEAIEARRDWLSERGIAYLFMIAPNKHTIYPQYLPNHVKRIQEVSRLDQLMEWMTERSDLSILDLRPQLSSAARRQKIYNQTGTHWNAQGAFIAYQQMMKALAQDFPDLTPRTLNDFTEQKIRYSGGLSRALGLHRILTEDFTRLRSRTERLARRSQESIRPSEKPRSAQHIPYAMVEGDEGGPRAVVFHDSFMNAIKPFLSEHFSRIAYYWQRNFDPSVIEHERPDVVIQEIVERRLVRNRPVSDLFNKFMKRQTSAYAEGSGTPIPLSEDLQGARVPASDPERSTLTPGASSSSRGLAPVKRGD